MNVYSYSTAARGHGVCHGTLWRHIEGGNSSHLQGTAGERTTDFCVLTGVRLRCYESVSAYQRGDFCTQSIYIVGASAWKPQQAVPSTSSVISMMTTVDTSFRLVSDQGTHYYCQAPSTRCRDLWLSTLYASLEQSLVQPTASQLESDSSNAFGEMPSAAPPPPTPLERVIFPSPEAQVSLKKPSPLVLRGKPSRFCASCGVLETTKPLVAATPLWQYGKESRSEVCHDCSIGQGLLDHLEFCVDLLSTLAYERQAIQQALDLIRDNVDSSRTEPQPLPSTPPPMERATATAPTRHSDSHGDPAITVNDDAGGDNDHDSSGTSESWTHISDRSSTPSPPDPSVHPDMTSSWQSLGASSCNTANTRSSSDAASPSKWVQLPPNEESTKVLLERLRSEQFAALARSCPVLERLKEQVVTGFLDVSDFMEQLEQAGGQRESRQSLLKQQAFRVAGDMGSAMKLLADYAVRDAGCEPQLLRCILDFFLDLVENRNELSSIAFFWPQLCHLHLRMLPPKNGAELARVELVEDFLITVAARHSIHLALELVWSHTADLEESLGIHTSAVCSAPCRRRRFAVLRFVCELESVLFDFEGAWGGGSVSLGKMLQPTGHQVELLKSTMKRIQVLRRQGNHRLTRSFLLEALSQSRLDKPADQAVKEKLRIAKNADYFSSHLNFTRRLCDTAEKLRFMDADRRAPALTEELELLNASGAMGGDPLNRLRDDLSRVVRIPSTEGHVFRSKERTPVLLLVEIVNEGAEVELVRESNHIVNTGPVAANAPQHTVEEPAPSIRQVETTSESADTVGVEILPALTEEHTDEEAKQPLACRPTSPVSRSTSSASVELEGSLHEKPSPRLSGLKRFEDVYETPTTPKSAVERLVSSVMEHQNMKLPELKAPDLLDEDQESGSDSEPIDTFQDAKQEPDELQIPLSTIPEHGSPSSATQDEQDPSSIPGKAESGPKEDIEQQQLECSEPCDTIAAHVHQETIACPELPVTPRKAVYEATRAKSDETDMPGTPVHEKVPPEVLEQSPSAVELTARDGSERIEKRGSKKKSTLGGLASSPGDVGMEHVLAPTGDVRREVLTAIMMRGMQGKDAIAIGAADSVQRSLKELERQRATELLLTSSLTEGESREPRAYSEHDSTRDKLASLGIGSISPTGSTDEDTRKVSTEEDEVMESIRLLLIQNRVAQGQLSEADAALVLQHTSLSKRNSSQSNTSSLSSSRRRRSRSLDRSEMPTIDAGDVDIRLVGCGALPPAILQALTLWRAEMVNNAELLELVKKDLEFLRHSVLHEAENMEKLHEDSAFWGRFAFGERWAEKKSRIAASSPEGSASGWDLVGVIVKSNDDLRQESFVMQLIELCQEAFELAGLELWVNPYRVLATGRTTGVIEMVRNAMSFDALKKRPGYGKGGLREHLHRMTEFTADPGDAFKSAQQNFVRSLAAYSLLSYLFQFKDRHNGNLLLDTAGHVIHIDFGFVFGIAPGGSFSLEMSTPFKLTEEMLDVMGGLRSPLFSEFVTLFCCGFLALQPYSGTFLTIVDIMCRDSTFKCFEGRDTDDVVSKLRERFAPDLSKEETVSFALDLIRQAVTSYGTKQYDLFQYLSQGIAT